VKHAKKLALALTAAVVLILVMLYVPDERASASFVVVDGVKIAVEIADTPAERNKGLSGRSGLAPEAGMLFVFEEPSTQPFWMSGMDFPLDLVWIGADLKVNEIHSAEPCLPGDCKLIMPEDPASYVLEVNKGFCMGHGIEAGDEVTLQL